MPLAVPPGAPGKPVISNVTGTSANVSFADGVIGSNPIDGRRIAYSTNAAAPSFDQTTSGGGYTIVFSDKNTPIGGLATATTYYVWARAHSFAGWGPWSARAQFYTQTVPDAPTTPWLEDVQPTSVRIGWNQNFNGGSEVNGFQVAWSTDPNNRQSFWNNVWSPVTITGLAPGVVYYFWVQARNSVGYSNWSGSVASRTVAGAYVFLDGQWRLAVPYVRDGGVWKLAQVWTRDAGNWRQTN